MPKLASEKFLNKNNAGKGEEMTESFSYPNAGVFCLTWNFKNFVNSIWVCDFFHAIKLFLSLKVKSKLLYFCNEGKEVEVFRRDK